MINSGIKGLIVSAQDKEAAKPIVAFATTAHIPVFTADADIDSPNVKMYVGFSSVLPLIKNGDIRMALDQVPGFYTAIAEHYLVMYLKKGDAGLPKVGDTSTARHLTLSTGVKHAGADIWADNSAWAPAKVVQGLARHL